MADDLVMAVRGPGPSSPPGAAMGHEHLFIQMPGRFTPATEALHGGPAAVTVTPRLQSWLRSHPVNNRDNLVVDDPATTLDEVEAYRLAGGGTLVDLTVVGLNPHPDALAAIAAQTDVHIVAATGFYQAHTL